MGLKCHGERVTGSSRAAPASLCAIARNDAEGIARIVASARPWVREICVVENGSDDDTAEAARKAGADVVVSRPDLIGADGILRSFADARNASYALASQPWRMFLDSDDDVHRWEAIGHVIERLDVERARAPEPVIGFLPYVTTGAVARPHPRLTHGADPSLGHPTEDALGHRRSTFCLP